MAQVMIVLQALSLILEPKPACKPRAVDRQANVQTDISMILDLKGVYLQLAMREKVTAQKVIILTQAWKPACLPGIMVAITAH